MREPVTAYIGIGANLGDAVGAVREAFETLGAIARTRVVMKSSLYRTAPHEASGPDYVNAVACVETQLDALTLLGELQRVENAAGRDRPYRNAPRTLDLDLLVYGTERIANDRLVVPHPRMHERAFVLIPLAEIAPGLVSARELDAVRGQRMDRLPSA
jgi:2-amino-4-hydroxy-6-hydroxymethyldihydropteridine diphosphokinase